MGTEEKSRARTAHIAESMNAYYKGSDETDRRYMATQLARAYIMGMMDGIEQEHESSMLIIHECFKETTPEPRSARLRCADGVDRTIALSESVSHPPAHLAEPK